MKTGESVALVPGQARKLQPEGVPWTEGRTDQKGVMPSPRNTDPSSETVRAEARDAMDDCHSDPASETGAAPLAGILAAGQDPRLVRQGDGAPKPVLSLLGLPPEERTITSCVTAEVQRFPVVLYDRARISATPRTDGGCSGPSASATNREQVQLTTRGRDSLGGREVGRWFSRPRREVRLPPENGRSTFR